MGEIGVCIYWGPWGGELVQSPIVSLGEGADCIVPEVPSLVKEDQVWMIVNDASRSVYSLYAKVPGSNSQDAVQLLVSCTMAKECHLVSKSPLDLLEALKALFERLFIVKKSEVRPRLERVDASFVQLLTSYSLETCPWYVFEMEGLLPGSFRVEDRNQLDALMRFNAYPALAHVMHLEIGFQCQSTVNINTKGNGVAQDVLVKKSWLERWTEKRREKAAKERLEKESAERERLAKEKEEKARIEQEKDVQKRQDEERREERKRTDKRNIVVDDDRVAYKKKEKKEIIMPPKYQVWVNGVAQDVFLQSESDKYVARLPRCETLSFDLGRLKSLPNHSLQSSTGNTIVKLDQDNQRIVCELKCIDGVTNDYYNVDFGYCCTSDRDASEYFENNIGRTINVYYRGNRWLGERIESLHQGAYNKTLYISPSKVDGFRFSIADFYLSSKDKYHVEISAKKMRQGLARSRAIEAINHKTTGFVLHDDLFYDLDSSEQEIVKWFLNLKVKDAIHYVGFERFIGDDKKTFKFDTWEQIETLYQKYNKKY